MQSNFLEKPEAVKICIIGSGNVAWHMARQLHKKGFQIIQICSRKIENAKPLAELVNCDSSEIENCTPNADIYLISVSDQAIPEVIQFIPEDKIALHTSGSTSIKILQDRFATYGVFYPLQTFSKERSIDFSKVPLFIEASNQELENALMEMGRKLSDKVSLANSHQRLQLHIAAVFACNFSNHLYTIAQDLLQENNIDFSVLHPLIQETVQKAIDLSPDKAQTGPAKRNDQSIIQKHIQLLNSDLHKKLYTDLSEAIRLKHKQQSND